MSSSNVHTLTQAEALRILFPNHGGSPEEVAGLPPLQQWAAWSPPSSALPVDAEITALIKNGKIGTRDEAFDRGIYCPYYTARQHIALGAARAAKEYAADCYKINTINPNIKSIAADVIKLVERAERLLSRERDTADVLMTSTSRMGEWPDVETPREDIVAAQATFAALRTVTPQLVELAQRLDTKSERIKPPHARGDVWRHTFVFRLDLLARLLVRAPLCKGGGLSHKFIHAAYMSIGGQKPSDDYWKSAISTAHDHFDKLPLWEQDARAAGRSTPNEIDRAVIAKSISAANSEAIVRRIVADAQSGNPEANRIAIRYYDQAPAEIRRLMEALGWTSEQRTEHPETAVDRGPSATRH